MKNNYKFGYFIICAFRVIATLAPQSGYIHPDEYFQCTEIIAGDFFGVEHARVWEFNANPIRSIAFPYIVAGFPYAVFKALQKILDCDASTYWVVVLPRITICMLSFLIDYSLYRICRICQKEFKSYSLVLASSFVMLIFGTRTFTNTSEMILLSILLRMAAEIIHKEEKDKYYADYPQKLRSRNKSNKSSNLSNISIIDKSSNLSNIEIFKIACVITCGVFNRPTFALFSTVPAFYILTNDLHSPSFLRKFHIRCLKLAVACLPAVFILVATDSIYFNMTSVADLLKWNKLRDSIVFTPYNFIAYNAIAENLATHGLHPTYQHILVNVPLIFGLLPLCGIKSLTSLSFGCLKGDAKPKVDPVKQMMLGTIIFSLATLSYFPHQEPRFIIPLIIPMVFLCVPSILSAVANEGIQSRRLFIVAWVASNFILTLFFGFIHQAGIYPLMSHMREVIRNNEQNATTHLVTSHIYSLPTSLLLLPIRKENSEATRTNQDFKLYEYGSANLDLPISQLKKILTQRSAINSTYITLPFSLHGKFENKLKLYNLKCDTSIIMYPHLSTEALPVFIELKEKSSFAERIQKLLTFESIANFLDLAGLLLCQVVEYYDAAS